MADQITVPTYEQIAVLLSRLATNYSAIASIFEKVFYDTTPQDVTFQMFNEQGEIQTYTIPNRAKDRALILNGSGVPEGFVEGSVGVIYQDTDDGDLYIKETPSGNEGWSLIVDKSYLDNFIIRGSGVPEGNVVAARGTLYLDTEASSLYIKTTMTGNDGWKLLSFDIDMSLFADIDLSNLSEIGQAVLDNKANINLSNLSAIGRAVINNKANIDLDNLSAEGQAIIDSKASVDLDNLSETGQNIIDSKANINLSNLSDIGQAKINSKADINLSNLSTEGNMKLKYYEPFAINTGVTKYGNNVTLSTNEEEVYKAQNVVASGSISFNKALVTDFSLDSYCYSNVLVDYHSLANYTPEEGSSVVGTFELCVSFTTGSDIMELQAIIGGFQVHKDPVCFYIKNGKLYVAMNCTEDSIVPDESEEEEVSESEGNYKYLNSILPNTYYTIRIKYSGTWLIYLDDVLMGELFDSPLSLGGSTGKDFVTFGVAYFGSNDFQAPFQGTLDLNGTYFITTATDDTTGELVETRWLGALEVDPQDAKWVEIIGENLYSGVCTLTTCTGITQVTESSSKNVSSFANGTYYIFKDAQNSQLSLASAFCVSKSQPATIVTQDWVSPSNMTGNGIWGGTDFALMSTQAPQINPLYYMFDGKTNICRLFYKNVGPRRFYVYTPKPVKLSKVAFTSVRASGYYPPNTVTVRGSNDMVNFTDLGSIEMLDTANDKIRELVTSANDFYQYFEFYMTGTQSSTKIPEQATIREIKMEGQAIIGVSTDSEVYWVDTSTYPVNLNILKQNSVKINNNLVFMGKCTIENGAVVDGSIYNRPFNACPYHRVLINSDYETVGNVTTWYNLYSDNWCEQGGCENFLSGKTSENSIQVTHPIAYINENYFATGILNTSVNPTSADDNIIYIHKDNNGKQMVFKFSRNLTARATGIDWESKGYVNEYYGRLKTTN